MVICGRSSFVVRRSSFVVRRSSFVVRRSSFVVRHLSFVVRRLSFLRSFVVPSFFRRSFVLSLVRRWSVVVPSSFRRCSFVPSFVVCRCCYVVQSFVCWPLMSSFVVVAVVVVVIRLLIRLLSLVPCCALLFVRRSLAVAFGCLYVVCRGFVLNARRVDTTVSSC